MRISQRGIRSSQMKVIQFVPPSMLSSSSPAPYVASGSTTESTNYPWKAFDRAGTSTYFQTSVAANASLTSFLQLDVGYPKILKSIKLTQAATTTYNIRDIQIQGSNDPAGGIWSNIGGQIGDITNASGTYTYAIENDLAYRHFRMCCKLTWGGTTVPRFYEVYFGVI